MSKPLTEDRFISVFIPTYNGEEYISECVDMILMQKMPKGFSLEILITDSGSKDSTVQIIKSKYQDKVTLFEIPNKEFGHGKTRQAATEVAKGEFILFLSQDATPFDDRWLINMIEPFYISEKIGCVFGRQIPRPHSVPTIKREVATVFARIGAPDSIVLHRENSLVDSSQVNSLNTFFSDVNSAVRKDTIKKVPFRDVAYAEDQALAQDMQNAGYLKAYSPAGAVWHSNKYTVKEYCYRKFDEYIGLQNSVSEVIKPSKKSLLLGWIRPTLQDWKFTKNDHEYNTYVKLKFTVTSPAYNIALQIGKYLALKHVGNKKIVQKLSLENQRKSN